MDKTIAMGTTSVMDDDARYEAVRRRDRAADGRFVYGVRTTGVYCRPGCGARLAKRENVAFFDTPDEARAAGFRACLRCRPDGVGTPERRAEAVKAACARLEEEDAPGLEALAAQAGLSPFHFHRVFREITGVTPRAYAAAARERRMRRSLASETSVTAAIYEAGFSGPGRFYDAAKQRLGMTPQAYRRGGAGERIRFAIGACSLGAILVAASDKGLCAILLDDDPDVLLRDLQDRFPNAELVGADPDFERTVALVVGLVEDPGRGVDLPLDVRGTAFQQKVWQALRAIPAGTTASYAAVAAALGQPSAVRAVAGACAANALAVAIPCHRVVRTDGSLSGYRWGLARKQALIAREGRSPATAAR